MKYLNYIQIFMAEVGHVLEEEDVKTAKQAGICFYNEEFAKAYPVVKSLAVELNLFHGSKINVLHEDPKGIYPKAAAFFELYQEIDKVLSSKNISLEDERLQKKHFNVYEAGLEDIKDPYKRVESEALLSTVYNLLLKQEKQQDEHNLDNFSDAIDDSFVLQNIANDLFKGHPSEDNEEQTEMVGDVIYDTLSGYVSSPRRVSRAELRKIISGALIKNCNGNNEYEIDSESLQELFELLQKHQNIQKNNTIKQQKMMFKLASLDNETEEDRKITLLLKKKAYRELGIEPAQVTDWLILKEQNILEDTKADASFLKNVPMRYREESNSQIPHRFEKKFQRLLKYWIDTEVENLYDGLGEIGQYAVDGGEKLNNNPYIQTIISEEMSDLLDSAEAAERYLNVHLNMIGYTKEHLPAIGKMDHDDLYVMDYIKDHYEEQCDIFCEQLDIFETEGAIVDKNYAKQLEKLPQNIEKYRLAEFSDVAMNAIYKFLQKEEQRYLNDLFFGIINENPDLENESLEFLQMHFKDANQAEKINENMNKRLAELYFLPLYQGEEPNSSEYILDIALRDGNLSEEENSHVVAIAKYRLKKSMNFYRKKIDEESIPMDISYNIEDLESVREKMNSLSTQMDKVKDIRNQQQRYYRNIEQPQKKVYTNEQMLIKKYIASRN